VNPVNITSKELAEKYRFISSPTIRVNGVDISSELEESDCADCGDLAGCSVDCRVFVYEGKNYEQPPVAMITDGILKAIYGQKPKEKSYMLPDNLIKFFDGVNIDGNNDCGCDSDCGCDNTQPNNKSRSEHTMKTMIIYEPAMCCPTGLCGVGVDPELLRISAALETLKTCGTEIKRYNLTNAPQEFVNNAEVSQRLTDEGVEVLPIVVVDGKIVITKRYPRNDEFEKLLDITCDCLHNACPTNADNSCGCESEESKGKEPIADDSCGCGCGEAGC